MMEDNRQENFNSGLTFGDVLKFLKKAVPMLLICVILCLIVGAIVGVGISLSDETNGNIQGTIELTYDGIEDGRDPNGAIYNSDGIRDVQTILTVLTNLGLNNKYDIAAIRNAIKITGVTPKKDANDDKTEVMPTKFNVTLNYKSVSGLTKSEAVSIVNNIMNTYTKSFEKQYIVSDRMTVDFITEADIKSSDFVELFSVITNELQYGLDYVASLHNIQFVSSKGDSISTIKTKIDSFMQKVNIIVANAKSNCIVRDETSTLNYLNYEIKRIEKEITAKNETLNSIKEFLESYSKQYPSVVVSGSSVANITVPKSDVFDNEFKKQSVIAEEKERLTKKMDNFQAWVTDLGAVHTPATAEDIAKVEASIIELTGAINVFIKSYNEFTEEYSDKELASDIKIISAASPVSSIVTVPWLRIMLISLGVGVVLGLVMTPAGVKIKEAIKVKKAKKAASVVAASGEDNVAISENTDSKDEE